MVETLRLTTFEPTELFLQMANTARLTSFLMKTLNFFLMQFSQL